VCGAIQQARTHTKVTDLCDLQHQDNRYAINSPWLKHRSTSTSTVVSPPNVNECAVYGQAEMSLLLCGAGPRLSPCWHYGCHQAPVRAAAVVAHLPV
jgi:hypothetical protein